MNIQELAETFTGLLNSADFDTAASYLSEDFKFSGAVPKPVDGKQWIGILKTMKNAFPDFKMNVRIQSVEGNVIKSVNQLTGTHTGDFDLSAMGMGIIPPTGKSFVNARESGVTTVKDGKITSNHITPVEGGGLMGILAQLGVQPPQ
jgi:predicted ester cyclase